jgi:hypothetical protein
VCELFFIGRSSFDVGNDYFWIVDIFWIFMLEHCIDVSSLVGPPSYRLSSPIDIRVFFF